MPLPYHLIDGYNLLHAAGLARATYGPGDLERARTGLLVRLAEGLDDSERERTTVVFDAADPPPDAAHSFRFRQMAVLFAVGGPEADDLIEDLIRRHPAPRQLRVVSDDVRLQRAAKRRGAQAVKSDALLRRLSRRDSGSSVPKERSEGVTENAPVSEWLEFFGVGNGRVEVDEPPSPLSAPSDTLSPGGGRIGEASKKDGSGGAVERKSARGAGGPAPPSPLPLQEEVPSEDFRFWQERIDELVRDDDRRPRAG